jgi:tRNA A-37 threonylcarbamoyl transferase component Bud32/predicted Zn-dependent protease/TolB-like protein
MGTKGKRTPPSLEPERASTWEDVDVLFDRALDQPSESRTEWVRANARTEGIANEVLALLSAAGRNNGVLDAGIPSTLAQLEPVTDVLPRLVAALEGRYRIERVLGQGGTATVFLAHETKHERPVVLKVLRPEAARWIGAERFLTEIQVLAKLSHPHILALIDSGEADGLLYYVMPYVGGETLRDRLHRGPLSADEALPLLRDTAVALAHAHQQGLVHRDLKPDNILVVSGHVFLMDFGIAKLRPEFAKGATIDGFAVGTPSYMAPEQAAGKPVDGRTDLYAWGIVADELLSGQVGRMRELPKSVPRELRQLIDQCLERDPAKRPQNGAEIVARINALTGHRISPNRLRAWVVGAVAAISALVVVLAKTLPSRGGALASVNGPVMVVPLTNETGDTSLAVWGRMAGDWLTQGLHHVGGVSVVPWPVALQASIAVRDRGESDPLRALSSESGAQAVVTGAYYLNGGDVRLQAQVTDARNGVVLAALPAIEVPRDSIRGGIHQLRDRLMAVFAIRSDERLADLPGIVDQPPTYEAYRLFDRGMDRFNALDYRPAAEAFMESWQRDTTFTVPLVYAATAWLNASQYQRADSLVRVLRTMAPRLNRYHDLTVRYTEATLAGDAQRALEMARQAAAVAPGGRAQYTVANTAMSVGRIDEALTAMRGLDPDKGVMKGWSPYWFVLTHLQHLKGDIAGEQASTDELRKRYPDSRAGWVHAVRVLGAAGKTNAADSMVAAASALPPDTYWSQGAMLVIIGEELEAHKHQGSQRYYQRAVSWLANQLARDPSHRAHRYWMGSVHLDRGAPNDAAPYFESLAHDYPDDIQFRGLWGLTAALSGDTALARQRLGPAPNYRRGDHIEYLARYAGAAGDKERAIALWSEAVGTGVWGMVWIHASAHRELALLADDPRFKRLGVLPSR